MYIPALVWKMGHGWHGCFWADSKQWGTKNVGGLPTPWKWVYPCAFTNNPIGYTLTRVTGVSCFSEIIQDVTTTYLTWIDQDYMGSSGGGDTINLIVIGW